MTVLESLTFRVVLFKTWCLGNYKVDLYEATQCLNKNCATAHSFITLANVGRFSKFFHCCILQEICNKTHANMSHTTP